MWHEKNQYISLTLCYSVFEPEFEDYKLEVQGLGTKGLLTFKTPKKLAPLKGNSAVSASGKRKTSIANVCFLHSVFLQ